MANNLYIRCTCTCTHTHARTQAHTISRKVILPLLNWTQVDVVNVGVPQVPNQQFQLFQTNFKAVLIQCIRQIGQSFVLCKLKNISRHLALA